MVLPDRSDDAEWKVKVGRDRVNHVVRTLIQLHCITPKLRVANHSVTHRASDLISGLVIAEHSASLQGISHGAKRWIKSGVSGDTPDAQIVSAGTSTADRWYRHCETQTYTVVDEEVANP